MGRRSVLTVAVALVCLAATALDPPGSASAADAAAPRHRDRATRATPAPLADTSLLVGFVEGATEVERAAAHRVAGVLDRQPVGRLPVEVVRPPVGRIEALRQRYLKHPSVAFVEDNGRMRHVGMPDDPRFAEQWGLHNTGQSGGLPDEDVDAPEGWEAAGYPLPHHDGKWNAGAWPTEAFTVGVVDSGVDTGANPVHPDLQGKVVSCRQARGTGTVIDGCEDLHGHGTHVTGTVAAIANNDTGVAGVAPMARIAMCAALDATGLGSYADVARCIDDLVSRAARWDIRVINLSLGDHLPSETVRLAVERATAAGILVVAAAGNWGTSERFYPAAYESVVSVGASDRHGNLGHFGSGPGGPGSNHNADVELSAPGVGVVSTVPGGYASASGTSMASPHVAGIAALVSARTGLTGSDLRTRLTSTAEDKGAPGRDAAFGFGRVNLCRALQSTRCGTSKPPLLAAKGPLVDPGFEYGPENPHWNELERTSFEVISDDFPRSHTFSADLCGYPSCNDVLRHSFTVPSGVTGVTVQPHVATRWQDLSSCNDRLQVGLSAADGKLLALAERCTDDSTGWAAPSMAFDAVLAGRQGQTVSLFFRGLTDTRGTGLDAHGQPLDTRWFVDDISLTFTNVPPRSGYWMLGTDGAVYAFGEARHFGNGNFGGVPAQDIEPTPTGNGYWVVDAAGRVNTFGDARYLGGAGHLQAGELVTSLSAHPSGTGYWMFTNLGRVLSFGSAPFFGDMGGARLNGPVLDSVATPSGKGYYMVASDGGVFAFGDAAFRGSMGNSFLNAPVQSLVPDGDGDGYWLVASDGGIFAFNAGFYGSMGHVRLNKPVTGMVGSGSAGYLMVAEDGGIFAFGDTMFHGSLGANPPPNPITAVALLPR